MSRRQLIDWMRTYWPRNSAIVLLPYLEHDATVLGLEVDYDNVIEAAVYCQTPVVVKEIT